MKFIYKRTNYKKSWWNFGCVSAGVYQVGRLDASIYERRQSVTATGSLLGTTVPFLPTDNVGTKNNKIQYNAMQYMVEIGKKNLTISLTEAQLQLDCILLYWLLLSTALRRIHTGYGTVRHGTAVQCNAYGNASGVNALTCGAVIELSKHFGKVSICSTFYAPPWLPCVVHIAGWFSESLAVYRLVDCCLGTTAFPRGRACIRLSAGRRWNHRDGRGRWRRWWSPNTEGIAQFNQSFNQSINQSTSSLLHGIGCAKTRRTIRTRAARAEYAIRRCLVGDMSP